MSARGGGMLRVTADLLEAFLQHGTTDALEVVDMPPDVRIEGVAYAQDQRVLTLLLSSAAWDGERGAITGHLERTADHVRIVYSRMPGH